MVYLLLCSLRLCVIQYRLNTTLELVLPLSFMNVEVLPGSLPVDVRDVAIEDTWAGVHNGQRHLALLISHHVQR